LTEGDGWLLVVPLGCTQRDRCVAGVEPTLDVPR
jgi:hypothetical protein